MNTSFPAALVLAGLLLVSACGNDSSNAGPGETCPEHPGYDRLDETNLSMILQCPEGSEIIHDLDIYACGYRDGEGRLVKHGPFVTWGVGDRIEIIGYYTEGKKTGCQVEWYANRQKFIESNHQQGLLHGDWHVWYEDGQKAEEGRWDMGCRVGQWTDWWENGQMLGRGRYDQYEVTRDWERWEEDGSYSGKFQTMPNPFCPNDEGYPDVSRGRMEYYPL